MNQLGAATLRRLVVVLFLASGFSGLVYQVAWVRLLTPVFGVTAYAISTVIASFMGGLALGSYVAGRLIDRRRDPLRVYALLEAGIGAYALLTPSLFELTNIVERLVYQTAGEGSPLVFGVLRAVIAF
jgi:spermidine synthase